MKRLQLPLLLLTPALCFLLAGEAALAGPKNQQSGEIQLEDVSAAQKNPYQDNQDSAIAFVRQMVEMITKLGDGGQVSTRPANVSENTMIHLTNAYLYCSIKYGTCPMLLDVLLESDVINSKLNNAPSCPNLQRFWKVWVRGDMEKRQKYLIRTANLNTTSDFNTRLRPKYIKCPETVAKIIADSPSVATFFVERYVEDAVALDSAKKALALLEDLKAKVPNIPNSLEALK